MPVSSPSYFPPSRANGSVVGITAGTNTTGSRNFLAMNEAGKGSSVSDLIVIGANAGENAIADANAQYSILIGSNAGSQLDTFSGSNAGPAIVIGGNSWAASLTGSSILLIGCGSFPLATSPSGGTGGTATGNSVVIGHGVGSGVPAGSYSTKQDVIIGNEILAQLDDPIYGHGNNVLIGYAVANNTPASVDQSFGFNVVIGAAAGQRLNTSNAVIIGGSACTNYIGPSGNGFGAVVIGSDTTLANANRNTVLIGYGASAAGGDQNVIIGTDSQVASGSTGGMTLIGDAAIRVFNWGAPSGSRCTFLGSNAGYEEPLGNSDVFIAETFDGATRRALLYGIMGTGNLLIGNSIPTGQAGANRDFGGTTSTNVVKILNGTVGNANPVGGGYFYVNAGALHWVGTSGTDTTLASA